MRSHFYVAAAGLLCAVAAPAAAQKRVAVDIPSGTLRSAVIALGRQASISIAIADPGLGALPVKRVRGQLTVEEALRRVLAGTPASFVAVGDASYRIVRRPASRARAPRPARAAMSAPTAPPPPREEEIVITATKRGTLLRDYPGPAVVVGDLPPLSEGQGTGGLVARITGLGSTHLGPGRNKLFIRGIADSSFNGQTQSTVGQYFGEARVNYNAADPDLRLYDLSSVELLPGPQGTLYGAGSMGGILRLVPNPPDVTSAGGAIMGSIALTAHGDPGGELAGVLNVPLDRSSAVRLVGYRILEGGYIDDIARGREDVNRTHVTGGRMAAATVIRDGWTIEAGGAVQAIRGKDAQYAEREAPPLSRRSRIAQPFSNDYGLAHATLRGEWGSHRLVSTLAAVSQELKEDYDISEPLDELRLFRQRSRAKLLSMETRLSHESGRSGWLIGANILRNRGRLDRASGAPDALAPLLGVRTLVDEQTLFGEVTRSLSDLFSITGGARLTHVRYQGSATAAPETLDESGTEDARSQWRLLPSLALAATPRPDLALFLRYQESFRPGGIVVRSGMTERLSSDHIRALEAGMRFGQRRGSPISGSVSLSFSRWNDVQADLIDTVGLPSTQNIGDGEIWTLDTRFAWQVAEGLKLSLDALFNHSELTNPNPGIITIDHEPLPNVADVNLRAGVEHVRSVGGAELRLAGWARYIGKSQLGYGPILGRSQGDYFDSGLSARLAFRRLALFASLTNLADTAGNRFALGSIFSLVFRDQITPLRPLTARFGLEVTM